MSEVNSNTKICSQCHLEKPVYEFHKHSREKDGYRRNCKQCRADNGECGYRKPAPPGFQWCRKCNTLFPATTEHFYRDKNTDKLYASCKTCHIKRTRSWHDRNIEFCNSLNHRWMITHPEKMKESQKKWQKTHPETYEKHKAKGIAQLRKLDILNPADKKARSKKGKAKRRAMMANAEGSHTQADLLQMYEDQGGHCAYCGIGIFWDIPKDIHVEHIKPLSRGGSNWPDNICLTCADCNQHKKDKTFFEWQAIRGW